MKWFWKLSIRKNVKKFWKADEKLINVLNKKNIWMRVNKTKEAVFKTKIKSNKYTTKISLIYITFFKFFFFADDGFDKVQSKLWNCRRTALIYWWSLSAFQKGIFIGALSTLAGIYLAPIILKSLFYIFLISVFVAFASKYTF